MTLSRSRRLVAFGLAMALTASACGSDGSSSNDAASPGAVGESAAGPLDLTAPLADGTTIDLGDLEGQDVVLWFWAPW